MQFVTLDVAAERLGGINVRTLRRMIDRGEIKGYRLPGTRRILVDMTEIIEKMEPVSPYAASSDRPRVVWSRDVFTEPTFEQMNGSLDLSAMVVYDRDDPASLERGYVETGSLAFYACKEIQDLFGSHPAGTLMFFSQGVRALPTLIQPSRVATCTAESATAVVAFVSEPA